MLRFTIRSIGLIALALGFVGIVIDGTRSMANASLLFASLAEVANTVLPTAMDNLQASFNAHGQPWLWENVCIYLLRLPASIVAFLLGALLLKLGQKKKLANSVSGMPPLR